MSACKATVTLQLQLIVLLVSISGLFASQSVTINESRLTRPLSQSLALLQTSTSVEFSIGLTSESVAGTPLSTVSLTLLMLEPTPRVSSANPASSLPSSPLLSLVTTTTINVPLHSTGSAVASLVALTPSTTAVETSKTITSYTPVPASTILLLLNSSSILTVSRSHTVTTTQVLGSSSIVYQADTTMPSTSVKVQDGGLVYVGAGISVAVVLTAVVTVSAISLYLCCRAKKYEYSTGSTDFRASVTVQRYNPNKEHYTVGSDSAFSSRGSSIRSSFGNFPSRAKKKSFTSADHVTAVINLEMFNTPV